MKENLGQLELALKRAKHPAEQLTALLDLLEALEALDFVRCEALAIKAIGLATELNAPSFLAKARQHAGTALWKLAEYESSMKYYDQALDQYLALGDLYGVAKCHIGKGIICGVLEDYRAALEYFEQALIASKKIKKLQLSATIVGNIGHVYFNIGRYMDALDCFERGLDFYAENDNAEGAANMLGGMAGVFVYQGELEKGLEYVKRCLKLNRKANNPHGTAITKMNIGITLRKMGRLEKAKLQLLDALAYTRSIQLRTVEFEVHQNLAQVCTELGLADESSKHLNAYLELEKEERRAGLIRKTEQDRQRLNLRNSM